MKTILINGVEEAKGLVAITKTVKGEKGMKRLKWRIQQWIIDTVCSWVVIGGHCGLCGKWIDDCLVPEWWPFTICKECQQEDK